MNRKITQYINQSKESVASNSKIKLNRVKQADLLNIEYHSNKLEGRSFAFRFMSKKKLKNISFKKMSILSLFHHPRVDTSRLTN